MMTPNRAVAICLTVHILETSFDKLPSPFYQHGSCFLFSHILFYSTSDAEECLMSQNHTTKCFRKAKEHSVQLQLYRSYCLTCTPGHVAA